MIVLPCGILQLVKNGKTKVISAAFAAWIVVLAASACEWLYSIFGSGNSAAWIDVGFCLFEIATSVLFILYTQNRFSRETAIVLSVLNLLCLVYCTYSFLSFESDGTSFGTLCIASEVVATVCWYVQIILMTVKFDRIKD